MTAIAGTVGRIRALREQLESQAAAWEGLAAAAEASEASPEAAPPGADLADRARAILARLDEIEGALHNPEAEMTYDIPRLLALAREAAVPHVVVPRL